MMSIESWRREHGWGVTVWKLARQIYLYGHSFDIGCIFRCRQNVMRVRKISFPRKQIARTVSLPTNA